VSGGTPSDRFVTGPAAEPEVWLRGPVADVPTPLQPVAHALLQALEDAGRLTARLQADDLWASPGGAATIGFHLRHAAGSMDRLLTYARGETLSAVQRGTLATEKDITPEVSAAELLAELRAVTERAIAQLRETPVDRLDDHRPVGRAAYPSSVRGLLYHAGEHTTRHLGQVSTTLKLLQHVRSTEPPSRPSGAGRDPA
jgi:uncharacterized damage-inducible protein DinB